jgi:hypothetical protein
MRRLFDIYHNTPDNTARFLLGKKGPRPLFVLGVNPSTADATHSDHTLTKIAGFVKRHGFNGFIVSNIYPVRATHPDRLPQHPDERLIHKNIKYIATYMHDIHSPVIWAAWGNTIEKRAYLLTCLKDIHYALRHYRPQWLHCGHFTNKKHPRHPSRLPYNSRFQTFYIDNYVKEHAHRML